MSDFLTRLVQLTRGEAAVVSPRIPGRFTPTTETRQLEPDPSGLEQHNQWATNRDLDRQQLITGSDQNSVLPGAAVGDALNPQSVAQSEQTKPADSETNNSAAEPEIPAAYSPIIPPTSANSDRKPASALTTDGVSLAEPTAEQPGKAAELSAVREDNVNKSKPQQSVGNGETNQPGVTKQVSRVDPPPLVTVIQNLSGKLQPPATEQPVFNTPETKQEPAVHVHIGRIDVRATTAAPVPAPRPARPKPKSSLQLQDYLKRGSGGGGR
jgi:hypothetical protein